MNFIPSESRERHAYIDGVVAETYRALTEIDGVADCLPRAVINAALGHLDGYFVPNHVDGVISVPPSQQDNDNLAITVVKDNEAAVLGQGFGSMPPNTTRQFEAKVDTWGFSDDQRNDFLQVVKDGLLDLEHGLNLQEFRTGKAQTKLAAVTRLLIDIDLDEPTFGIPAGDAAMLIPGRSLVTMHLRPDDLFVPRLTDASSMFHEMQHVEQTARDPFENIEDEDMRMRRELEAYHYEDILQDALFFSQDTRYSGNGLIWTSYPVETIRKRHQDNPDDPFAPNEAIKQALAAERLRII